MEMLFKDLTCIPGSTLMMLLSIRLQGLLFLVWSFLTRRARPNSSRSNKLLQASELDDLETIPASCSNSTQDGIEDIDNHLKED